MHVTWAAGWALVGVLSGGVAAFDGFDVQKPFSRSGFRVSSEQTIVPLDDKAGTGLLPPALENGAIASRESCSITPPVFPSPNGLVHGHYKPNNTVNVT